MNTSHFQPTTFSSVEANLNAYNNRMSNQANGGIFQGDTPKSNVQNISPTNASGNMMSPTNPLQSQGLRRDMSADKLLSIKSKNRFNPLAMEYGGLQMATNEHLIEKQNKVIPGFIQNQAYMSGNYQRVPDYPGVPNNHQVSDITSPGEGARSKGFNPLLTTFGNQGNSDKQNPLLTRQGSGPMFGNTSSQQGFMSQFTSPTHRQNPQNPLQQNLSNSPPGFDPKNPLMRVPHFERRIEAPRKK